MSVSAHTRVLATAVVATAAILLFTVAAGCGGSPRPSTAQVRLGPPVHASASRITGWWSMSGRDSVLPGGVATWTVHVFAAGDRLRVALDDVQTPPQSLSPQGDTFVSDATPDLPALRLWVSADGRLNMVSVRDGKTLSKAAFTAETAIQSRNEVIRQNAERLELAVDEWLQKNGSLPSLAQVRPGTAFARAVRPWPVNPFTGAPMAPGRGKGDYHYHFTSGMWGIDVVDAYGHDIKSSGTY